MTDPIPQPGTDDRALDDVTDRVVQTWTDATPDKEPTATADDFERMREGFGQLVSPAPNDGDPAA